jgi:hypothetical protein
LRTASARQLVAKALYDVLWDGIDFGPCELPRPEDREWMRGAIAIPIQEATDIALQGLAWQIAVAFEHAPRGILERFDRSHAGQDLGWE